MRLPLHVQKLKSVLASGGASPLDRVTSFSCTQQLNKVDIWATEKKNIAPPVPGPLSSVAHQLQIPSAVHVAQV